jgi:lysophospholipase L1-like esterase
MIFMAGMTVLAMLAAAPIAASSAMARPGAVEPHSGGWSGAWMAAVMRPSGAPWFPTWAEQGFDHQSVRQVIRLSAGGSQLRIRVSNAYGMTPLRLSGASVGQTDKGAAVLAGTIRPLQFEHSDSVTIPANGKAVSDPVRLPVKPRERVTVTLYFDGPTGPATYHQVSMTTTYRADGDHRTDTDPGAFTDKIEPGFGSWYYLAGAEVAGGRPERDAVVAFGESTTDGFGATPDGDDRYPDFLAERLLAAGQPRPVLNAGIGSNKMLADSACAGDSALSRFERDVLDQPRVSTVIIWQGMNDILRPGDQLCGVDRNDPPVTLQRLIDAHRTLIRAAHARSVKVIGATLMPFGGSPTWTKETDKLRKELNNWIRNSGEYDAVADFDKAIDPSATGSIPARYDSGDHLHPNPLGYQTIANSIDLNALQ